MKKLCLLLTLLLLVLAGCADTPAETTAAPSSQATTAATAAPSSSVPVSGSKKPSPPPIPADMTVEDAQSIALEHAGLTAEQVTDLHTELDSEYGDFRYDVEFDCDGYEYEYEIDPTSGVVLSHKKTRDT